jgi:predicted extracellular nuclease
LAHQHETQLIPQTKEPVALRKRAADATTLRTHITQVLAGAGQTTPAVLLRDMNDHPQAAAATTQILLGPPRSEIGTPGETILDHGDATRQFNLAPELPADQQYSRIDRDRRQLIDHILISHDLLAAVRRHQEVVPPQHQDAGSRRRASPNSTTNGPSSGTT